MNDKEKLNQGKKIIENCVDELGDGRIKSEITKILEK